MARTLSSYEQAWRESRGIPAIDPDDGVPSEAAPPAPEITPPLTPDADPSAISVEKTAAPASEPAKSSKRK